MRAEFHVNVDAVVEAAEYIGMSVSRAGPIIESEMFSLVKEVLVDEFEYAGRLANSDGGFPESYQQHLVKNVRQIVPTVIFSGNEVFVSVDLEDWLGGYDDLTRAYHRRAKLADGGEVTGPYEGEALKQEDAGIRHVYWQAMRSGASKADINGRHVPVQGSWEETQKEYLEIWGDKSPQWLFIQFGQEEWDPTVMQVDIIYNIENAIRNVAGPVLENYIARTVAIANSYKTAGLDVGYTGDKSPPRVISGTVTVNGKTYRPGRFVPKGGL